MKPRFKTHFSIDEARELLPELRSIFQDIHRRQDDIGRDGRYLAALLDQIGGDAGGSVMTSLFLDVLQVNMQLRRVQDMGVQIKDVERGLLDFPHFHDGHEVFLCWELDESDIEYWHDIDRGYADREPLFGME